MDFRPLAVFADPTILNLLLKSEATGQATGAATFRTQISLVLLSSLSMLLRVTCMEACYFCSARVANNTRSALLVGLFRATILGRKGGGGGGNSGNSGNSGGGGGNSGDSGGGGSGGDNGGGGNGSQGKRASLSTGEQTNLMATDADLIGRTEWLLWVVASWTWSVCSLPAILYMMWRLLGSAAFVGISCFLVSNFGASYLSVVAEPLQRRLQERRDERGELIGELVRAVVLVKTYAMEGAWGRQIGDVRRRELRQLMLLRYVDAAITLVCGLMAQAVPVSIFSWYVLVQKEPLRPAVAFTALAWLTQINWSINSLPAVFQMRAALLPSLRRLAAALDTVVTDGTADGIDAAMPASRAIRGSRRRPTNGEGEEPLTINGPPPRRVGAASRTRAGTNGLANDGRAPLLCNELPHGVCGGSGVDGRGPSTVELPYLTDEVVRLEHALLLPLDGDGDGGEEASGRSVRGEGGMEAGGGRSVHEVHADRLFDLSVSRGELLIICGPVGAGKSTLLAVLSGARDHAAGRITRAGSRSYVSQPPFILRDTVAENVTFGLPYEEGRYREALRGAALEADVSRMPLGDQTDAGEGGAMLSGGQRARVALARALYARADAMYLEDVFASVDAPTCAALWQTLCTLHAAGVTIVLATNHSSLFACSEVGRLALLANGRLVAVAPFEQVRGLVTSAGLSSGSVGGPATQGSGTVQSDDGELASPAHLGAHSSPREQPRLATAGRTASEAGVESEAGAAGWQGGSDEEHEGHEVGLTIEACLRHVRGSLRRLEGKACTAPSSPQTCLRSARARASRPVGLQGPTLRAWTLPGPSQPSWCGARRPYHRQCARGACLCLSSLGHQPGPG